MLVHWTKKKPKTSNFNKKGNFFSLLKKILSPKLKYVTYGVKGKQQNNTISHFLMKSKLEILKKRRKEGKSKTYLHSSKLRRNPFLFLRPVFQKLLTSLARPLSLQVCKNPYWLIFGQDLSKDIPSVRRQTPGAQSEGNLRKNN